MASVIPPPLTSNNPGLNAARAAAGVTDEASGAAAFAANNPPPLLLGEKKTADALPTVGIPDPGTVIPDASTPDDTVPPPVTPPAASTNATPDGGTQNPPPDTLPEIFPSKDGKSYSTIEQANAADARYAQSVADNTPPPPPAAGNPAATSTTDPNLANYDAAIAQAKALATGTVDPAYAAAFNAAVQSIGLGNQQAADALQMKINSDPELKGQPSGTAFLLMAARDAGLSFDQAVAQLSQTSAQHISDMNQFGLQQITAITNARSGYQQTQLNNLITAGDYDGYANQVEANTGVKPDVSELKESSPTTIALATNLTNAIQNAVANGDTAGAKTLYAQLQGIQPKSYGSLTFDQYMTSAQQYAARTQQTDAIDTRVRNDIQKVAAGPNADYSAVVSDLHQRYTEDESTKGGQALIDGGALTLDEANRLLTQAGMDKVTSLDQLTADGRQDDIFIAQQLDKAINNSNAAGNTLASNAKTYAIYLGLDPTNPDVQTQLQAFLRQNPFTVNADGTLTFNASAVQDPLSYTDPNNSISQHFVDWPVVVGGATTYAGWQPYSASNTKSSPTDPNYQYENTLNTAYENYLNTPGSHVSRQDWFNSVKGNAANFDANGVLITDPSKIATGKDLGASVVGSVTLPNPVPANVTSVLTQTYAPGDEKDPVKQAAYQSALQTVLSDPANAAAFLSDKANVLTALKFGSLGDLSSASKLKFDTSDYDAKAAVNNGWIVGPDGNAYQMQRVNGQNYNATLYGTGYGFVATGTDGKQYFIVTKTTSGGKPVGSVLPLTASTKPDFHQATGTLSSGDNSNSAANSQINGSYYAYTGGA